MAKEKAARRQAALEEMRGGVGRDTGGGGFGKGDSPSDAPGSPFRKGGRVQYGNGGIVDLL